jgi:hypothetical protein
MLERMKSVWCITMRCAIAMGLVLALPACTDFKRISFVVRRVIV